MFSWQRAILLFQYWSLNYSQHWVPSTNSSDSLCATCGSCSLPAPKVRTAFGLSCQSRVHPAISKYFTDVMLLFILYKRGQRQWGHVNCLIFQLADQWQFWENRLIHLQPSFLATDQWHLYISVTSSALAKRFPETHYCFSTNCSYRRKLFWLCNWNVAEGHQRTSYADAFLAASVVAVEHRDLKNSEMHRVTAWKVMITLHMSFKCDRNNYSRSTWTRHRFMCWTLSC